jgi:hypothetical protein
MKKLIFTGIFFMTLLLNAASAVKLEGGFKVGPAIILITMLVLFV